MNHIKNTSPFTSSPPHHLTSQSPSQKITRSPLESPSKISLHSTSHPLTNHLLNSLSPPTPPHPTSPKRAQISSAYNLRDDAVISLSRSRNGEVMSMMRSLSHLKIHRKSTHTTRGRQRREADNDARHLSGSVSSIERSSGAARTIFVLFVSQDVRSCLLRISQFYFCVCGVGYVGCWCEIEFYSSTHPVNKRRFDG
jgi:hypothetical protein